MYTHIYMQLYRDLLTERELAKMFDPYMEDIRGCGFILAIYS